MHAGEWNASSSVESTTPHNAPAGSRTVFVLRADRTVELSCATAAADRREPPVYAADSRFSFSPDKIRESGVPACEHVSRRCFSRSTHSASCAGGSLVNRRAHLGRHSAVAMMSLTPMPMPCSAPRRFRRRVATTASRARARIEMPTFDAGIGGRDKRDLCVGDRRAVSVSASIASAVSFMSSRVRSKACNATLCPSPPDPPNERRGRHSAVPRQGHACKSLRTVSPARSVGLPRSRRAGHVPRAASARRTSASDTGRSAKAWPDTPRQAQASQNSKPISCGLSAFSTSGAPAAPAPDTVCCLCARPHDVRRTTLRMRAAPAQ